MSYKLTDYKNLDFFNKIDTEEKAYWLGFIYADGNVSKDKGLFQIHLQKKDEEHLRKIGNIFNKSIYTGSYHKSNGKEYSYAILTVFNKEVKNGLLGCGIYPNKTKIDNIDVFKKINDKFIHHFIRGVFDGDGCITKTILKSGKINYCLSIAGSPRFLIILKNILMGKIGISNTKTAEVEGCNIIRWSGIEQINLIYKWLYRDASVYLERKKLRMEDYSKNIKSRGKSKYRGVAWHKDNDKWLASISYNKKRINLGYYRKDKEAAIAYDKAVIKYNKPLYKLNFSKEE